MRTLLFEAAQVMLRRTNQMVVAQGLGHEGGPAAWERKGHHRLGPPTSGNYASHVA